MINRETENNQEITNNNFIILPHEILKIIFSLVDIKDIHRLPLVCQEFNNIINKFYMNFNYSNKAFFIKWLTNEVNTTTHALQKILDNKLTIKLFNRPDLTCYEKTFYYYSFFAIFIEIYFLIAKYLINPPTLTISKYNEKLIIEKKQSVMQYRLSPNAGDHIMQHYISELEKNIREYETTSNESSYYTYYINLISDITCFFIFLNFILMMCSLYQSKNNFSHKLIKIETLQKLKNVIKKHYMIPDDFISTNNIQLGQINNNQLKNILQLTINELQTFTNDISAFLRQPKFTGNILEESNLAELTPTSIKQAKHTFLLFSKKFPEKKIYNETNLQPLSNSW